MEQTSNLKNLEPTSLVTTLTVNTIYAAFVYVYSPTFVFKGETHKAWELVYAHKGEVIIETPEHTQVLHKGEVFIHKPYEFHKIRANKELLGVLPKEAPFEGLHERLSAFYQKTIDTEAKSADEIDYLKQTQEIFEMGYTHYFREKKNKTDEATSKGKNLKETKLEEDMEDLEAIISDFYSILRIAKFIKGEEVKDE